MKKIIIIVFLTISLSLFLPSLSVSAKKIDSCPVNINKIKLEEECKISLGSLHPTQAKVGMYQIEYNLALLNLIDDNKSDRYDSIKDYLKDKVVPVVIGPNNIFYMVDRHHTLRAIFDYYKGDLDTKVYVEFIENWSNKNDFWQAMKDNNYTYLGVGKDEINPNQLPENIGELTNDNYRSAVGLAVKWAFLEKPKGNAVYFYQFKWGNCLKQLGFNLPEKIDREDIYSTAAFLYNEDNQAKFANVCNIEITQPKSLKSIAKKLEN